MWELDYKECWAPKNWCFWTVVVEKTLENPLDCKEIQPVHPKGNQSWIFTGRTDAEAPLLWLPDSKNRLSRIDSELRKIEGRREMGQQSMRWLDGIPEQWTWIWVISRSSWWTGKPGVMQCMGSQSQKRLSEWTKLTELRSYKLHRQTENEFSYVLTVTDISFVSSHPWSETVE